MHCTVSMSFSTLGVGMQCNDMYDTYTNDIAAAVRQYTTVDLCTSASQHPKIEMTSLNILWSLAVQTAHSRADS